MSRIVRFHKFMQVENKVILFDIRVLKCQMETASNPPSSKLSCKWFQMKHWEEVLSLLTPKIKGSETLKVDRISPKSVRTEILTGALVKIAYCFLDSYHPTRRILIPKPNNQSIPMSDSLGCGFESLTLCQTKVVISVCNLMTTAIQDIANLFKAISQPASQTVEKTLEVSHYFNQQSKENANSNSVTDEDHKFEAPPLANSTPVQKVVLRKVIREGLPNEKKSRRPRLKRKLTVSNNKGENDTSDSTEDRKRKADNVNTASKPQSVKSLTLTEIEESFRRNKKYISKISRGKIECRRHRDYIVGGTKRKDLDYQVNLSFYSEAQVQHVMTLLKGLFAPKEYEMLDYILKVLLPEFLIKVYMDATGLTYEETEQKMRSNIDSDSSSSSVY